MSGKTPLTRRPAWFLTLLSLGLGGWPLAGFGLNPVHQCSFCHYLHGAEGVPILAEEEVEVLCLTCHIAGALELAPDADVHTNREVSDYADFRATCLRCHNPHDNVENWIGEHDHVVNDPTEWGINIKLVGSAGSDGFAVIQSIEWDATTGSYLDGIRYVVFEQLGDSTDTSLQIHSFSDENMDGLSTPDDKEKDGACEGCHNQTKYHCNGDDSNIGDCEPDSDDPDDADDPDDSGPGSGSGSDHHTGETCTNCHHHAANFLPRSEDSGSSSGKP